MSQENLQLRYYINLGAPPTRTEALGDEPFMRPEVGFNPSWFYKYCGIDFGEEYHKEPKVRMESHRKMSVEIKKKFPGYNIGGVLNDQPIDIITGMYGIGILDKIFGRPIRYFSDKWPVPEGEPMTEDEVDALTIPDLTNNEFFQNIFSQIEEIYRLTGSTRGYLNWQGVLNTAFRFRGQDIFTDMISAPERADHLFNVVADTMIASIKLLHAKQREYGVENEFATISNCTVNTVGPKLYDQFLLPLDIKIRNEFKNFGIHNCAWTVTPYLDGYRKVPNLGYLDMGIDSDLVKAKSLFTETRRNILYTSMNLKNKSDEELRKDFEKIAEELAPCDVGLPDIENDVPDERIMFSIDLCSELTQKYSDDGN
ncbi:hypothetical protein ACFLR4_04695 [Bacteroidota bacterium]